MSALPVRRPEVGLDVLAVEIRAEHEACESAAQSAVDHAIRAGELLIEAKEQVRHGEWLPWLEANFPATERTARNYMRIATNRQRVSDLGTVREALAELAEPREVVVERLVPREHLDNEATWQHRYGDEPVPPSYTTAEEEGVADVVPIRAEVLPPRDKMAVHFSSATDEWATPQDFFDRVAEEFDFELDVCALPSSAKCERYFGPEDDGLSQDWTGVCWMNPPYGTEIGLWVRKAWESGKAGATVVCLVPARTDTNWWHDHCGDAEVRFIKGRLRFGDAEASAPFPNALVVFGREASMTNWEWR